MALLRVLWEHEQQGQSQFIIATHSPILLGYPKAHIYHYLATLLPSSHPVHQTSSHTLSLQAFAIDYGWIPQQHNQLVAYAKLLQGYRLVILGSGDENPKNGEIPSIRELQTMLPTTKWYGYISIGINHGESDYSYLAIEKRIQEWKQLHVNGMLLDCAGPSYGTSEARRAWAMNAVHLAGMHVLMNAFTPQS